MAARALGLRTPREWQARELEIENRQLRRTISSLSKATAAERQTYQALQRDLQGYKDAISAISEESEHNRSRRQPLRQDARVSVRRACPGILHEAASVPSSIFTG